MSRLEMVSRTSENFLHTAANTLSTVSADLSFDQQKYLLAALGVVIFGGGMFWLARQVRKHDHAPKWPRKH